MNSVINTVTPDAKEYPHLLREITSSPTLLYYKGALPSVSEYIIAVVGTRKATRGGKAFAKHIANDLAERGVIVVSGLALGIDGAAHEGALLGGNKTIAILANGLDTIYPSEHWRLGEEIVRNGGCILSEYKSGTPAFPNQFLERNRIISGLSSAVVIIEAPARSGALSTARYALEQGREIFVVPGPPKSENYRGSHLLIRAGARLVTSAEEILDDLAPLGVPSGTHTGSVMRNIEDSDERHIVETLQQSGSLSASEIIKATKLDPTLVNQKLSILTIHGIIDESHGKFMVNI